MLIKLKEISKYYYTDKSVTLALKDINLEFKKGEFVAITGKSGSGKSTLINLISGMDTYEEGELFFKGMETSYYDDADWELYRKNNISFIYQSYNLIDSYTALQNIESVMMICETEETRLTKRERKKKALEILEKVGLRKQAHNRASHMSSGQKQRLGIARALAKNTDIIIADEPTGNLDVENGKAIMAILHQLAKENKLVIVVTHNYEQAEPYVTRKIRLFDGEVVEDLRIDKKLYEDNDFQSDFGSEVHEEKEAYKTFGTARRFVHMNRLAQPHRSLFILIFIIISAMATLIFTGYFVSNIDDTKTKIPSYDAFFNVSDDRIMIKRLDGNQLDDGDYEKILDISRVKTIDKFDHAGDCNYFAVEDTDYKKKYNVGAVTRQVDIEKLNFDKFLRSSYGLSDTDLSYGRLPESKYEIVLYDEDDSRLGETIDIYVSDIKWRNEYYAGAEFTVVGILKEETDQIYFSELFTNDMDKAADIGYMKYEITVHDNKDYKDESVKDVVTDKRQNKACVLIIGEGLTGNQIRMSSSIINTLLPDGEDRGDYVWYTNLLPDGVLSIGTGEKNEMKDIEVSVLSEGTMCSENVVEVSEELYYEILGDRETFQSSVYIEDYAYTDSVIDKLYDSGYEAVSVLRVSSVEYDSGLVSERLVMLIVCVAVILIIFVLDILVIYLLMKLKKGDFLIMKSLGMKQKMANQMNYYELATTTLAAYIIVIIAGIICNELKVPLVSDFMKYMRVQHYVTVIIINAAMAMVTGKLYNRYLGKRFKLTSLRNND